MLTLAKISTKKLIIYISIIVLMFGGVGFMLYQNQKLTNGTAAVVNGPAQPGGLNTVEGAVPGGQAALVGSSTVPLNAEAIINNQGIDSAIFSSEKFKQLKENTLIPRASSIPGKRDPFKPN